MLVYGEGGELPVVYSRVSEWLIKIYPRLPTGAWVWLHGQRTSGVQSEGAKPVPPVVTIRFGAPSYASAHDVMRA